MKLYRGFLYVIRGLLNKICWYVSVGREKKWLEKGWIAINKSEINKINFYITGPKIFKQKPLCST